MLNRLIKVLCVVCAVAFTGAVRAEEVGTADEAQALVKKAIALYKASGRDKAFAAISDPKGDFQHKDLYVFIQDLKGNMLAHGKNPGLVGKDLSGLKDADGKLFVAEMMQVAATKGSGWVDYKWVNAQTKKIEPKSSYIERQDDLFFGAGIYKH
jgi:cytochrome c